MLYSSSSRNNRLLAALPESVRERWLPKLEWVYMPLGQVLHEPGQLLSHVYFPVTAIVSLIYVTGSGASSGVASIGNEGLVGVETFMGGRAMPCRAAVHSTGYGFRLPAALVNRGIEECGATLKLLLRYTEALRVQIAQLAVCNRHHSLEQRLSHWLLWQLDHLNSGEISATHELVSSLLGVRRESVTEGLCKLQNRGLIHYSRGHIAVINRTGLAKRSCECTHVIKLAYGRLSVGDIGTKTESTKTGSFVEPVVATAPQKLPREALKRKRKHCAEVMPNPPDMRAAFALPAAV